MKRVVLGIAVLLAAQGAFATAVRYEFRQTTSSDIENFPSSDCTGRAVIDGERSRVEFIAGDAYPPGTYVIATNGSRNLIFVDPAKKSFVEINAAGVATAIGSSNITIANRKVDVTQLPDHPVIAGIPTDHYRLVISYDITLRMGTIPMTQAVHTIIDKWVTTAFGDLAETFLTANTVKTGNADIDELTSIENTKVKGFALRETTAVTTSTNRQNIPGSDLSKVFRTTRTQTKEITVTSIELATTVSAAEFVVPATFRRADPLHDDTQKTPINVLSMETPGSGH
jgi:hypothetical protein